MIVVKAYSISQGNTINLVLEKFGCMVIDKYSVEASYINPDEESLPAMSEKGRIIDHGWFSYYSISSQYLLQIVKCDF